MESNIWCPRLTAAMILSGSLVQRKGRGKAADLGAKAFGEGWQDRLRELGEEALWRAHNLAVLGLDPEGEREPWLWFNKIVASATGAAGGFFGLPGLSSLCLVDQRLAC